ncbi:hypothetical protein V6N11_056227 [Hibiscus sabdariffa]|uniref:Reverse transcriptase domain-containing protein n=1 Tax=Hibiscus sabdariffa TaxID=183260 RepID=A0ABR2T423_9ROSI
MHFDDFDICLGEWIPFGKIYIPRGVRQGYSLSPLLFNLVGEGLHQMLSKAASLGLFSSFLVGKRSNTIEVTHLQFADDLMIFFLRSFFRISEECEEGFKGLRIGGWPTVKFEEI